jgi:hypothetical protein
MNMPRQLCPIPAAGLEFDGVRVWPDADEKVSLLVYDEAMHGEMVRRWEKFPDLVLSLRSIAQTAGRWHPTPLGLCGEMARDALRAIGEPVEGDRMPMYHQLRQALVNLLGPNVTAEQIHHARTLVIQAKG